MLTKGFVRIFSRQSTDGDQIAKHGELSRISRTYARQIDSYLPGNYTNYEYLAFLTQDNGGNSVELTATQSQRLFDIVHWFYSEALNGSLPSDRDDLRNHFFGYHSDTEYLLDQIGPIVTDGDFHLPGYVHFRHIESGQTQTEYYLWFADEIFQTTYDGYQITIIPPTDNLDDIFDRPNYVENQANERDHSDFLERIEGHRHGEPCTHLRTEKVAFRHPSDLNYEYQCYWTFLIYGQAGNNFDTLLQEIENLISRNSAYGISEWRELAPGFFHHTEFILIPLWDQFAIENNNLKAGIYSPLVQYQGLIDTAMDYTTLNIYDESYLRSNLTIAHSAYKNLPFLAIGNPENKSSKTRLQDLFSDYIVVAGTSSEFSRMSNYTQQWVITLNKALREAETADSYNFLPDGMSRLYRSERMYILFEYDGFRYLILSRKTYNEISES